MKIYLKNQPNISIPKAATENSLGYDIVAVGKPKIVGESIEIPMEGLKLYKNIDYIEYSTNLFVAPGAKNEYLEIYPRSSVTTRNLVLKNSIGLIDPDYRGQLLVRFAYVSQPEDFFILPEAGLTRIYTRINNDKIYQDGDKIAQLVGKKGRRIEFCSVDELPATNRGTGGFGSTGK